MFNFKNFLYSIDTLSIQNKTKAKLIPGLREFALRNTCTYPQNTTLDMHIKKAIRIFVVCEVLMSNNTSSIAILNFERG